MSDAVPIESFLEQEGFDSEGARLRARSFLEDAGLTRPGKQKMARDKEERASALLAGHLLRLCGEEECERLGRSRGAPHREVVRVSSTACEVCAGSNNRRAALAMAQRLRQSGVRRVLVVGGTARLHAEIEGLLAGAGIEIRFVLGAERSHSSRDAGPDLAWAELMVIWGATPLPHKVSRLYTGAPPARLRIVRFARRGIESLCREVIRSFDVRGQVSF